MWAQSICFIGAAYTIPIRKWVLILVFFVKFVYQTFFLPPGIFILMLILVSFLAYRKKSKLWKATSALALALYLLSIPLVGDNLIHSLENNYEPAPGVSGDVIIMLGAGATFDTVNVNGEGHLSGFSANRLLTCAQLYHKLNVPIIITDGHIEGVTGSAAIVGKDILVSLGIPEDKIIVEDKSLNTTQNAQYSKEIVDKGGFQSPILVTSAFHMPRSVKQFEKVDLHVTPYPTDYQTNAEQHFSINDLIPSPDALYRTSLSIKEFIGILVSRWY